MAQKLVLLSLNGDIVEEAKAAIKKEFRSYGCYRPTRHDRGRVGSSSTWKPSAGWQLPHRSDG